MKPWATFNHHHSGAVEHAQKLLLEPDSWATASLAQILAILAVAQACRAQALELRRIRKLLEGAAADSKVVAVGLSAQAVPKEPQGG